MAAAFALGCAIALPVGAQPALAPADASGPSLMCGGVGSDSRYAMEDAARDANLRIELFIAQGGEYIAGVDLMLRPLGAGDTVSVRSEGPICYLRVAPGKYRIEASFEGITRSAQADVPARTNRPVRVALGFPKSVGDRQTDAASPEEKAQAARRP